jgi:hypothetical protein
VTVEVRLNVVVHCRSSLMGCVGGGVGSSSDPKCFGSVGLLLLHSPLFSWCLQYCCCKSRGCCHVFVQFCF